MPKVRVNGFAISLDGYGAGPNQSLDDPLGKGGPKLHDWFYPTRTFRTQVLGKEGGTTGPDDAMAARGMEGVGAWILGRNMFGPVRGPWPDEAWRGWWGDEPPYHVPTFVLTHHAREPLEMAGGTVFHFVTEGIHAALDRARDAAGERDIRIGGGAGTIRQYLGAGLVDEMHLVVSPTVLGGGEPLLAGIDLKAAGLTRVAYQPGEGAGHYILGRD